MFVKITHAYRDVTRNGILIPTEGIYEVSEERGTELIEAGVGEKYIFPIPKQKKASGTKEDKNKSE